MEKLLRCIEIVIWPVLILFLVWYIRKPLENLISLVQTIKCKGFEIKFSEDLARIKENTGEISQAKQELIIDKQKLYGLIEVSPASSMIEVWKALEISTREKMKNCCLLMNHSKLRLIEIW